MNIVPNGQVILYQNIPLQSDYKITYWFDTIEHQESYFSNQTQIQLFPNDEPTYRGKFSYIRKGKNKLKIECSMQKLLNCNYMSFINRNNVGENTFENKTYYCFVEDIAYVNNTTTEITYHIDLMQTYLFDIQLKQSFILRQHEEHDTLYGNLQPENLSTGEYISEKYHPYIPVLGKPSPSIYSSDYTIVVMYDPQIISNEVLAGLWGNTFYEVHRPPYAYSNIYQGCDFLVFPMVKSMVDIFYHVIRGLDTLTFHGILNIFIVPSICVPEPFDEETETESDFLSKQLNVASNTWKNNGTNEVISRKENAFENYTPHNKKLFTYPYCYLYATNFRGATEIYKYEYFSYGEDSEHHVIPNVYFVFRGNFSAEPALIMTPTNYKNTNMNNDDSLTVNNFPTCSYVTTNVVDWLAKAAMISVGSYTSANGSTYDYAGFGGLSTYQAGKNSIKQTPVYDASYNETQELTLNNNKVNGFDAVKQMLEKQKPSYYENEVENITTAQGYHFKMPLMFGEKTQGVANTDVLFGNGETDTFGIFKMQVRQEYARRIDSFFTMYGYAQNKLGVPNIHARSNWTYVQTENCYLHGNNMQFAHEKQIEEIFNKGITFWAYNGTSPIGDYSHPENNTELGGNYESKKR